MAPKKEPKKVRVVRAFYYERKPVKVGEVVELPHIFALEVCASNKAVMVEDTPEPAAKPAAAPKKAPAQNGHGQKKGGEHAG